MNVGIYTRDSDGKVKVRRLIEATEYDPVPGYTFKGEIEESDLPPRDETRDAWVAPTKTVSVDLAKATVITAARRPK